MRQHRETLEDKIQACTYKLQHEGLAGPKRAELQGILDVLQSKRDQLRQRHREELRKHHELYHSVWGSVVKTGYQNSFLSHQIERFACIYTSHVNNLIFYSPFRSYRGRVDKLPHEDDSSVFSNMTGDAMLSSDDEQET